MNGVGSKELAPLHHSTVDGCVAAEITKIKRTLKAEVAVWVDGSECEICFVHESEATCNRWVHDDSSGAVSPQHIWCEKC